MQPWARIAASSAQTSPGVDPFLARLLEVDAEPEVVLDLDEQVGQADRATAGVQPAVQLGEAVRLRRVGLLGRVRLEPPPVVVERDPPPRAGTTLSAWRYSCSSAGLTPGAREALAANGDSPTGAARPRRPRHR